MNLKHESTTYFSRISAPLLRAACLPVLLLVLASTTHAESAPKRSKLRAVVRRPGIATLVLRNTAGHPALLEFALGRSGFHPLGHFPSVGKRRLQLKIFQNGVFRFRAKAQLPNGSWRSSNMTRVRIRHGERHAYRLLELLPGKPRVPRLPARLTICPEFSSTESIRLVNEVRRARNLSPLSESQPLANAAQSHSIWMASKEVLSHTGWFQRISEAGAIGHYFAQNIAAHANTADGALRGWLSSPSHADNVFSAKAQQIGVACVRSSSGVPYWSQVFSD